jgi:hypothetical protein
MGDIDKASMEASEVPPVVGSLTHKACWVVARSLVGGCKAWMMKMGVKPWSGPLPALRMSPRITFGDVLSKAKVSKNANFPSCTPKIPYARGVPANIAGGGHGGRNLYGTRQAMVELQKLLVPTISNAHDNQSGDVRSFKEKDLEPRQRWNQNRSINSLCGLETFFAKTFSPHPIQLAPHIKPKRLGFPSYAAALMAPPPADEHGDRHQGGRNNQENARRMAPRGGYHYEGPNFFRPGRADRGCNLGRGEGFSGRAPSRYGLVVVHLGEVMGVRGTTDSPRLQHRPPHIHLLPLPLAPNWMLGRGAIRRLRRWHSYSKPSR